MEVKLINLINSKTALTALQKINFKAIHGIKIKKMISMVNTELQLFEDELKEKQAILFKDVPEGEQPRVDKMNAFNEEMEEVTQQLIVLPAEMVKLSYFAKTNGAINDKTEWHDFNAADFQVLDWLIVDDIE